MGTERALDTNLTPEVQKNLYGNAYLNMLWHCPSDPRFHYWVHLPDYYAEKEKTNYQLMVLIHGTGCAIESYLREAREWADRNRVALLAPIFPGGLIDRNDFNSYKLLSCDRIRYDMILLSMIEDMEMRYPGVFADEFFLFGHSGGGQFANRFLYVHPERLKAVSIGAPGRPTFLESEEPYFWGVKDFRDYFDQELDLDLIREVPVQITVGEKDTKFIGESAYGTNRVERMKSLKKNFEDNQMAVELEILQGLGHGCGEKARVQAAQRFFEKYL